MKCSLPYNDALFTLNFKGMDRIFMHRNRPKVSYKPFGSSRKLQ